MVNIFFILLTIYDLHKNQIFDFVFRNLWLISIEILFDKANLQPV